MSTPSLLPSNGLLPGGEMPFDCPFGEGSLMIMTNGMFSSTELFPSINKFFTHKFILILKK